MSGASVKAGELGQQRRRGKSFRVTAHEERAARCPDERRSTVWGKMPGAGPPAGCWTVSLSPLSRPLSPGSAQAFADILSALTGRGSGEPHPAACPAGSCVISGRLGAVFLHRALTRRPRAVGWRSPRWCRRWPCGRSARTRRRLGSAGWPHRHGRNILTRIIHQRFGTAVRRRVDGWRQRRGMTGLDSCGDRLVRGHIAPAFTAAA